MIQHLRDGPAIQPGAVRKGREGVPGDMVGNFLFDTGIGCDELIILVKCRGFTLNVLLISSIHLWIAWFLLQYRE